MSERFKYLKKIRRKLANRIMYSISIFFRNFFGKQSTVGDGPVLKNIDFSAQNNKIVKKTLLL